MSRPLHAAGRNRSGAPPARKRCLLRRYCRYPKLEAIATREALAGGLIVLHGLRTAEAMLAWTVEVETMLGEDAP